MISILIPIFNYNTTQLISELKKQCDAQEIVYEIIALEDGSDLYLDENKKSNQLQNITILHRKYNLGRMPTRYELAEKAQFDNLLFIDSDSLINPLFIKNYCEVIDKSSVIFGGCEYSNIHYNQQHLFRHRFGIIKEQQSALERNKKPYHYIFSGNLLIKKHIFLAMNLSQIQGYGTDLLVNHYLKTNQIPVNHINNPIQHHGLEDNEVFVNKKLEATKNFYHWYQHDKSLKDSSSILSLYSKIKLFGLHFILGFLYKKFHVQLKYFAIHPQKSLYWFDFYRLCYLCSLK